MDPETALAAVTDVIRACEARHLSLDDQLALLEATWLIRAKQARAAASVWPDRFFAEQTSQLSHLERMAALVRVDARAEPQIHDDIHSVWEHLQSLRNREPDRSQIRNDPGS